MWDGIGDLPITGLYVSLCMPVCLQWRSSITAATLSRPPARLLKGVTRRTIWKKSWRHELATMSAGMLPSRWFISASMSVSLPACLPACGFYATVDANVPIIARARYQAHDIR